MFENKVLRKIFGSKRDEVTVKWRRLHNEELCDLYCWRNFIQVTKSRRIRWAGKVACMGESRGVYRVSEERPDKNRPLGRPRHRREDNIKINIEKMGWGMWTGLIWLRIGTGSSRL